MQLHWECALRGQQPELDTRDQNGENFALCEQCRQVVQRWMLNFMQSTMKRIGVWYRPSVKSHGQKKLGTENTTVIALPAKKKESCGILETHTFFF